jgi:DNA-binding PadR family transcriptional regulator
MERITVLGYALLGLLRQKPSSGYQLRKIFAETPMGSFSDSPGAIYPALRRLEDRKLIRVSPNAGPSQRRRKVFQLSPEGVVALKKWLRAPVTQSDVANRMTELMLKFAFIEAALGSRATIAFLCSFDRALNAYLAVLAKYVQRNHAAMPTSARLALQSGLLGYRAQAKWLAHAIETYQEKVDR